MKKQSNLSRLLEIAGSHKYLTYASWVLSAISALIALVPFYYIWKMIKEVLEVAPNFDQAQNLTGNGWMAVLFAVIAVLVYIAGLMCSHLGAFRIATNLRIQTMEHIVRLPLGFAESFGSGKLRKIVNESSAATETYLAHQLPDRANAIATLTNNINRSVLASISFPTEPMPLQPPVVFWCCCSCLTGDWAC